jgi:hypothetical protein
MSDERRADIAAHPWSFKQGTLRERLEWARDQHAYASGRVGWPPPVPFLKSLEEYNAWHADCADWYAGMVRDLDTALGVIEAARAVKEYYHRVVHETWCEQRTAEPDEKVPCDCGMESAVSDFDALRAVLAKWNGLGISSASTATGRSWM